MLEDDRDPETKQTALIPASPQQHTLPGCLGSEKVWRGIGFTVTCAAMLPQGFLGMVLWDDHVAQPYFTMPVRIGTDFCIMFGSIVGKLMIVYYFNGGKWAEFAHADGSVFNPRHWTLAGMASFPVSTFFGWLAGEGCKQAAVVMQDYGIPAFNHIAHVIRHPGFFGPFCAVAFGANLLSFPPIHSGAVGLLRSTALEVVESAEFRGLRQQFGYDVLETVRMHLKILFDQCRKTGDYDPYITAVQQILPVGHEVTRDSATHIDRARLIAYAHSLEQKAPRQGWWEWGLNRLGHWTAAGLVTAGVWNFPKLTYNFMAQLLCYLSRQDTTPCAASESIPGQVFTKLYAGMVIISMAAMATCVMSNATRRALNHAFGRHPLNPLGWFGSILNSIWAIGIIGFGAAPNTQQAIMAQLSLFLTILAPLSSMGYEGTGVYDITEGEVVKPDIFSFFLSGKPWEVQLAYQIEKALQSWMENISEEDIRALETAQCATITAEATPRYSSWCNSVYSFFSGWRRSGYSAVPDEATGLTPKNPSVNYVGARFPRP